MLWRTHYNRVGGRDPDVSRSQLSLMLNIFTSAYEGKLFVVQQTVDKEPKAATSKDEVLPYSNMLGRILLIARGSIGRSHATALGCVWWTQEYH